MDVPFACPRCFHVLVDRKALADHLWMHDSTGDQLKRICCTHENILWQESSPLTSSVTVQMEKALHFALCHEGECDLLRVNWNYIRKNYVQKAVKLILDPTATTKRTASSEGYTYCSENPNDIESGNHLIKFDCSFPSCIAFAALIGRHDRSRVEELMWIQSRRQHNHRPSDIYQRLIPEESICKDTPFRFTFDKECFLLKQKFPDGMEVFECNGPCSKLITKYPEGDYYEVAESSHCHRITFADHSVQFENEDESRIRSNPATYNFAYRPPSPFSTPGEYVKNTPSIEYIDDQSNNFNTSLQIIRDHLKTYAPEKHLKAYLASTCLEISIMFTPNRTTGPFCILPGFGEYLRYDPHETKFSIQSLQRLVNSSSDVCPSSWYVICGHPDCFSRSKSHGLCIQHSQNVLRITLWKVNTETMQKLVEEFCPVSINIRKMYYLEMDKCRIEGTAVTNSVRSLNQVKAGEGVCSQILKKLKPDELVRVHRIRIVGQDHFAKATRLYSSYKVFLHLYAMMVNAACPTSEVLILNSTILLKEDKFDMDFITSLLRRQKFQIWFESSSDSRSRGSTNDAQKWVNEERTAGSVNGKTIIQYIWTGHDKMLDKASQSALYTVTLRNFCYVGLSVDGSIPLSHGSVSGGISTDKGSLGLLLRSLDSTNTFRDIFARVDKSKNMSYESAAILTLMLGFHKGHCWKNLRTTADVVINSRIDFPDISFDLYNSMSCLACYFFNRRLLYEIQDTEIRDPVSFEFPY